MTPLRIVVFNPLRFLAIRKPSPLHTHAPFYVVLMNKNQLFYHTFICSVHNFVFNTYNNNNIIITIISIVMMIIMIIYINNIKAEAVGNHW